MFIIKGYTVVTVMSIDLLYINYPTHNPSPPQFTPSAGPVNGGTTLTIEGLNIGADRGHLDHVRVGDVNCAIIEYIPGVM